MVSSLTSSTYSYMVRALPPFYSPLVLLATFEAPIRERLGPAKMKLRATRRDMGHHGMPA